MASARPPCRRSTWYFRVRTPLRSPSAGSQQTPHLFSAKNDAQERPRGVGMPFAPAVTPAISWPNHRRPSTCVNKSSPVDTLVLPVLAARTSPMRLPSDTAVRKHMPSTRPPSRTTPRAPSNARKSYPVATSVSTRATMGAHADAAPLGHRAATMSAVPRVCAIPTAVGSARME